MNGKKWLVLGIFICACIGWGAIAGERGVFEPAQLRADFLKVIARPRVELAAKEWQAVADGDLVRVDFSYAADGKQRVPGILIEPRDSGAARRAAVIVLHGTGGKKEGEVNFLKRLAGRGFVAVAIDGRYHGERAKQYGDYNAAIARAFREGGEHPFYYDTVWDVMRLVDYLRSRADVDGNRIGLMGISKGGIETYLAAAVDTRIAAAVPCIGVESFGWALEHNAWQPRIATVQRGFDAAMKEAGVTRADAAFVKRFYDRVVPGIDSEFDGPSMMRLVAPRPMLVINGELDAKTPPESIRMCEEAARGAYEAAGAAEKFKLIVEPGVGHKVTPKSYDAAVAWFERWLKSEPISRRG